MLVALGLVARSVRFGALLPVALAGIVYGAFLVDRYLPELGPHWSQKHVIAAYYANRSGPDEPLIVYNLYWRGENFYTRNEVYSQAEPSEKWAWVEPNNMSSQTWFQRHKGTRIFILVERHRLEQVRGLLPVGSRAGLKIVDDSNNKLLLVEARISATARRRTKMSTMRPLAIALLMAATSHVAAAQEPMFEALGQAPIVAGDRVRARDRALEEALRQAVEQATATVLEPSDLVARAADLKLRIYPKAKSYITTYRILDEGEEAPGTFQVHLSAAVATARLARDLSTTVGGTTPVMSRRARAVVCAQVQGDGVDAPAAAEKALREIVAARNVEPMPGPQPCDPQSVASVMRSGTSQAALTAEVQVTPGGDIRGTTFVGAGARATVKLIEPDGRVSASGDAERSGYAPSAGDAATAAARAAVVEAARTIDPALAQRWSGTSGPSGGVTVRVHGVERWAEYQALTRALASLPGVAGVEPRRFVRGEIDLVVHTASAASQLAGHLMRVPPAGVRVGVRTAGDAVEIDVAGEAEERG